MSIIEAYLAGPLDLRPAVEGLSREQLVSRPVPGKWSILEVVSTSPTQMPTSPTGSSASCRRSDRPSSAYSPT